MISKKFLKASAIYTVIGSLPLASSLVLLPFYTNLLSLSDFGLLALYIAFSLLIQIIVNWSFDSAIQRYYYDYKDNKQKLNEYIGTVATSLLLFGLICTVFFLISGDFIFNLIFKKANLFFFPYGLMSILTAVFNSFFKTYTNLLIHQERAERFFWLNILNFILTITISLVGLYVFPYTLIGPIWGRLLSGVGIFIAAAYLLYREFGFHFKFDFVKKTLPYSNPLLIFGIVSWVLSYIDRYIINYYIDISDVGIFDFAVKCTFLIDFLIMALATAVTPKIYSIWTEQKINYSTPEVNRYYNAFTALVVIIIAVNIFFIPVSVPLVVKKINYYEAFKYLPLIALGHVFRGLNMMFVSPIFFFKKTKLLPWTFVILALLKIILSIIFIKNFGLWGAVWAMFLINLFTVVALAIASKKIFTYQYNKIKLILLPGIYLILVIVLEQITSFFNMHFLHFFTMCLTVFVIGWIYRKEIKVTLLNLRKK